MDNTASDVLSTALSRPQAIKELNISCDDRFVSAKDRFRASREQATIAFNNKSLSIKDRIMACKLRVAATILESGLEDPEAATTACLLSLEELHYLPTIQEMFLVFLKGGMKSMFKKAERLENMMSVLFINHALYDFASKCRSKASNPFSWPGIELNFKNRTFHSILHAHKILREKSNGDELVQELNRVIIDSSICFNDFAVNSRGHIVLLSDDKITVIYSAGESKEVMFPKAAESNVVGQWRNSVAVDSNDNVYAVTRRTIREENVIMPELVLYVFDESYNIRRVSILDCDDEKRYSDVKIAADKNENLIVITDWNDKVYVIDINTSGLLAQLQRALSKMAEYESVCS